MASEVRRDLFESMPIPKAVFSLAIPTVLSSLVIVLYNLADTYFVGFLNDPVQNAAVTLSSPVLLAFNAVNNLFGIGTSSMMSRALGSGESDRVRRISSFGFYSSLFFSVLFSLSFALSSSFILDMLGCDGTTREATRGYLFWTVECGAVPAIMGVVMAYLARSEGSSLNASIGTMSGCLLNIALDPLFILPSFLGMGAEGAGLATFLSNCFSCLYFALFLAKNKGKTLVSANPKLFSLDRAIALGVFAVGIPACVQNLLNVTGMTILNNLASAYGASAVAAMGISQKTVLITVQISLGFSQGIMPLVGYNYSSGNYARMKKSILFTLAICLAFLVCCLVLFRAFAANIVMLFMKDEGVVSYGIAFLKAFSLEIPFLCLDFIGIGVYQACGLGKVSFFFAIMRKIILEIPLTIILDKVYPLYGLSYAQPMTEMVLACIAIVVLICLFRKWEGKKQLN